MGGVKGNVYCCNAIDGKLRTYDTQPVYCFAELSPGQILLGCAYGLLLMDKETGKLDILLSGYTVHDIAVADRIIWVCTFRRGDRFEYAYSRTSTHYYTAGVTK